VGRLVADEIANDVDRLEVGLVAERGEAREPQAHLGDEQTQLEGEVAALGDQADRAARQLVPPDVEIRAGVEHAHAVGPEQQSPRLADPACDVPLARLAVQTRLAQAGRDADDGPCSHGERVVHDRLEGAFGDRDHDELRRARELSEGTPRRSSENGAAVPVHQVDVTPVLPAQRTPSERVPPGRRVVRRADDRDRPWIEQGREIAGHGRSATAGTCWRRVTPRSGACCGSLAPPAGARCASHLARPVLARIAPDARCGTGQASCSVSDAPSSTRLSHRSP
jgi:hypothetical protein